MCESVRVTLSRVGPWALMGHVTFDVQCPFEGSMVLDLERGGRANVGGLCLGIKGQAWRRILFQSGLATADPRGVLWGGRVGDSRLRVL